MDYCKGFQKDSIGRRLILRVAAFAWLFSVPFFVSAQILVLNDNFLDSGINTAVRKYDAAIGGSARLYNGSQYREYELHEYDTGFPYFIFDDPMAGTVGYDGQTVPNVYLLYNLITNKVIVENPFNNAKIELISEKVSEFTMGEHHFVRLTGDSTVQFSIATGFYDILYNGEIQVYAKRAKEISVKIESGVEKKKFIDRSKYFIRKGNLYFPEWTKSSVLDVLSDRKAKVRKMLEKNKLRFGRNREFAIVELARYYDQSEDLP